MKVATLTLPLHTNYGGNLQAFALQKTLIKLGHDAVLLNYRKGALRKSIFRRVASKIKNFALPSNKTSHFVFSQHEQNEINKHHDSFIKKNIITSSPFYDEDSLKKFILDNKIECVIVGSDQVWRPKYTPKISPFYLNFIYEHSNIKKVSYAASFGVDLWEYTSSELSECKKLIASFDSISVRESIAVDMCQEFFEVDAEHVLDPTLLLSKDEYINLFEKYNMPSFKGKIFSYVLDSDENKTAFMDQISSFLNKEIFTTYPKKHIKTESIISNISDYQFPSVEAWLKSFHDADFVVTDSFHGTVFAIIFNKPFIAICNKERGSARFKSLLKMFSLEDRLVYDMTEVDFNLVNSPIDYDRVNEDLNLQRIKSLDFLAKALSIPVNV
ncbi:TPA: polysaccharide pyruvyl transferase family protein [Raoultella ornithinolytica]|nr:polysaccharide pyruvyl transferase family protein [Raoultella ornithinolytica]